MLTYITWVVYVLKGDNDTVPALVLVFSFMLLSVIFERLLVDDNYSWNIALHMPFGDIDPF